MNAAQLLVKCLENEGVEYIFGIPGEENIDIMDALLDSPIRFVTTHHEQGAAHERDRERTEEGVGQRHPSPPGRPVSAPDARYVFFGIQ